MTGWESPSHWLIIALVVLVLFGYKRLPEMSRSLGRSLRIFKTEIKGMGQDDAARDSAETVAPVASTPPAAPVVAPVVTEPVAAQPPVTPSAVAPVTPLPPVTLPPTAEEPSQPPQQRTQA